MITFAFLLICCKESTIDLDNFAAAIRLGLLLDSPPLLDGQWITIIWIFSPNNSPETTNWSLDLNLSFPGMVNLTDLLEVTLKCKGS